MTYQGRVKNGVIVLDEGSAAPPEGAAVRVELVLSEKPLPTLAERFKSVIGQAKGLPADFADNHDRYIHRTPKNE